MRHLLFSIILGLTALVAVVLGLPQSSRADGGASLDLASDYDGQVITAGQTINFTAQFTNTDTTTRAYIFAAQVPTGTILVSADSDLQTNSYSIGIAATVTDTRSLTWEGEVSPQQTQTFTYTLAISSAGIDPGGDIPVTSLVFDTDSGQEIARQTITLDWPGFVYYLPLLFHRYSGTTPTPPPASGRFTPTIAGVLQSQSDNYNTVLTGGEIQGQDSLYGVQPEYYWSLNLSLVQCRFADLVYMVHRDYLEYDTTNVDSFSKAYLVFKNNTAYPGPPAHTVNIYEGTWTQLLTDIPQVDPGNWSAYDDLVATAPGNSQQLPVTVTVPIPAGYINAGGITKFAFKSSTEGSAPADYSCQGGADGLGASISLPYLYLELQD